MSSSEPFNTLGGYSVGIPPQTVIDANGNVVTNVNAPSSNITANRVFANSYLYANGDPLSIGASGSNTQVQYNNNGLLGASANFTFNSSNNLLTVTNLKVGTNANLGNVSNVIILGGTNGYFLQTDGSGNLTWAPAGNGGNGGNGNPGGANTQVQFNNAGNFAGDAGFTYNNTTNILSVDNITVAANVTAAKVYTTGNVNANKVYANYFLGDGSNISNVATANVANTVSVAAQPNITSVGTLTSLNLSGNITNANWTFSDYFSGNGNPLYGIVAANIVGTIANAANANFAAYAGNVTVANQPNITNVGNLANLTVIGNTTLGNQVTSNYFIGNLFGLANLARYVTFANQPNITSVGTLTSLTVTGNTTLGNSVTANYFTGNLYGTANIALIANVANLATQANNSNTAYFANYANFTNYVEEANIANVAYSVDGSNVIGTVSSANVANTVTNAAQPNITSVGELTNLTVIGNITSSGNVTGNFIGNGSRLSNLTGANVIGNVANATYAANAGSANVATTATSANTAITVTGNSQPNITSIGSLTTLEVTSNIVAGNVLADNGFMRANYFVGNFYGTATTALTANTVTTNAQPNITSLGTLTNVTVSGNANVGNLGAAQVLATANVRAPQLISNVANGTAPLVVNSTTQVANLNSATAGTVTTAAQPNITSLGLLTNVAVTGNATAGNVYANTGTIGASLLAGTLSTNAQPNVTSLGTLTGLNVNGNITAANIVANTGIFSGNGSGLTNLSGGNVTGQVANAVVSGTVYNAAQPNITSLGTLTTLNVNGSANLGNISNIKINGGSNGFVLSTDGSGNLNWVAQGNGGGNTNPAGNNTFLQYNNNGVFGASANLTYDDSVQHLFVNGTANANGNITAKAFISNVATGTAPLVVESTTPVANLAAQTAATVRTNAQPNITSVGTLTSLTVSGNVGAGNVNVANSVVATLLTGTITTAAQPNITSVGTLTSLGVNGVITAVNITANTGVFTGNGSGLSQLTGANVTGAVANATYALSANTANVATSATSASTANTVTNNAQPNITSVGTLTGLNVTGNILAGNINANSVVLSNGAFLGNGSGLFSINASNITTGVLSSGRLIGQYDIEVTQSNTANTVINSSQPNITNVGTLNGLTVNGITTLGNVGNIKISGGTNGYVLQTDGTGNLSWTAQTGGNGNGSPGGATTQIQYNQDGNFAGSPNLSWTNSTNFLYVGGNATVTNTITASVLSSNVSNGTAPLVVQSTTPVANLSVETAGTVRNAAQPNITSVGTLTGLNVTGNIVTNNLTVNTNFTTNGNIVTPLNVYANSGTVKATLLTGILTTATQPNITTIGTLAVLSVTGNVSAGNVSGGNLVSANFVSGTLTTNAQPNINFLGNIGWLNVNTALPNSNGNITFNGSMSGTGLASNITITGNLAAGNFVEANYIVGTLTTNLQPNITTLGTLTGLNVNGTSNLGNIGNVKITGGINGYVLSTDGTGNLNWIAQSNGGGGNGIPGGSNTQIQFNDAGSFGGSANFTFNKINSLLYVTGSGFFTSNITASSIISTVSTGVAPLVINSTTPVANLAAATADTVRNSLQPNITSVGTLTGLTVAGNATVSNLTVDNSFSVSGNIITSSNVFANNGTVRGLLLTGTLTTGAQPNIISVGTLTSLNVTGNIIAGNVSGGNLVSANFLTGVLTTNNQPNINYIGKLGHLIVDTAIANGNGNITFNGSITGNGAASNINITGNVNAGNFVQAELLIGTLTTSSQPNITSLGNLTSLTVLGNSNLGSVSNVKITGGIANYVLSTDGSGNLSWVEQTSGGNSQPGGPNYSVQFNNLGILGGVSNLTYNPLTSNLLLSGNANIIGTATVQVLRSSVPSGTAPLIVNSNTTVANLSVETALSVINAAQPNITSVGTLTNLSVLGNISGSNLSITNNTSTNNLTVTNNITTGNLSTPGTIGVTTLNVTGNAGFTGNVSLLSNTVANRFTVTGNVNANTSPNVTLGNVANLHIFGGINGYYLQTDGAGNLSWAPASGGGGNGVPGGANTQIQFNDAGEFGGAAGFTFNKSNNLLTVNTISVTSNISVTNNVIANKVSANFLSGDGSNVSNVVAVLANVANTVAGANVTGQVNFAAIANAVQGANVIGQVNFAAVANSVAGANVTGQVGFAAVANSVAGANVVGSVANAVYADNAGNANIANSANNSNTAITVTASSQPNITSVGTLVSLDVTGNVIAGNLYANAGTVRGNLIFGNYILGELITPVQPNIVSIGTLTSLTVNGTTNTTFLVANTANIGTINANTTNTQNLAVTGNAVVSGNLTVNGNLIYVNVETLAVEDPIIELQVGPNGNPPVANSGKDVGTALNYFDTDARKAFMGWDVSGQEFIMAARSEITNEVVTVLEFGNLHIGNIIGNGQALTGINAANVVGTVPLANFANFAGNVTLSNQPNITTLGTLTGLTVNGITNLGPNSNVKITGGSVNQVLTTDGTGNLFWSAGAGGSSVQVLDEGVILTNAVANINFVGAGVSASTAGNYVTINIPGVSSNLTVQDEGLVVGNPGTINTINFTGIGVTATGAGNTITVNVPGGSGTPGGANTAVQYNNAGALGGSAFFSFNNVTNTVTVAGNLVANAIQIGAGAYDFSTSNVFFATTNSAASDQTILAIPVNGLAAVDYTIISTDGTIRNFIKISAVRVGSSINYVEYSTLPVNGYTGDFTVSYFAGNIITPASIVLKCSPQTANLMTHKMMVTVYKE